MRRTLSPVVVILLTAAFSTLVPAQATHPLDPLSASEIEKTVELLKTSPTFPKAALFSTVQLREPTKDVVLAHAPGRAISRSSFSIFFDRINNKTFEAIVDLTAGKVSSVNEIPGVQPLVFTSEYGALEELVKADPRWLAAMKKRGIEDPDDVAVDGWAVGQISDEYKGRLLRGLSYYKKGVSNYYGRPIEGVVAIVNMNERRVLSVTDTGVVPVSKAGHDLDEGSVGKLRERIKPLAITQPEGASYQLSGNEVRWQNWRFRYTMHPREGLVLHTVGYEDGGKVRPILYRASLSEMVVPYGDPDENWRWRAAFDVGEYSVGRLASPLEPNVDAPSNAQFLGAVFSDDDGKPYTHENAVAIYERDGGILWKHYDSVNQKNESRRARDLVMSFVATIGNYDYAVNYIFKQDGSIEIDLALTGIMLAKGVTEKVQTDHDQHTGGSTGHLVAEHIVAPHHQHFFSFRLDFDVDGVKNSVTEMNSIAMKPGNENPYLNGFVMRETRFRSEKEAQRPLDLQAARIWTIANHTERNSLGQNTSFILVPGANAVPYVAPDSSVRRRAQFINNHFWATNYKDLELYAAGDYPNQSKGGDGLPRFAADDQSIVGQDVVVWYTLGVTHIPRPEEWPVMPTTHVGFKLIPGSFFARNPAMDVPK